MMTHKDRVELYKKILLEKQVALTEFNVALMRAKAPNQMAADALNEALKELGYTR